MRDIMYVCLNRMDTYINNIILGIVSICTTNIESIALHFLNDTNMIFAIENLKRDKKNV